jgi:hypothetical protein
VHSHIFLKLKKQNIVEQQQAELLRLPQLLLELLSLFSAEEKKKGEGQGRSGVTHKVSKSFTKKLECKSENNSSSRQRQQTRADSSGNC